MSLRNVSWQELRKIALLLGCVESRQRGDHLIMTRGDLARPVVIKMDNDLGEDLVRSFMRILGLSRAEFENHLRHFRGQKKEIKKQGSENPEKNGAKKREGPPDKGA